jgi:hypothetical protein
MLRSFVAWLDDYLAGEDSSAVVRSAIGLMGFAVLLGVILGNTAVKSSALVVAILLILAAMLILLADRRRILGEANTHKRLLMRYCDFILNDAKPVVQVKRWEQKVSIAPNGDAKETITINATVLRDELYFLRLWASSNWEQPSRHRRRVKVKVRSLFTGSRGPRWAVTSSWTHNGRLNLIAHLHSPVSKGTELQIEMIRDWPGKCVPLMRDRKADEFTFRFSPAIKIVEAIFVVTLPKGEDVYYEPIGFQEFNTDCTIVTSVNGDDSVEVVLTVKDMPADQAIGMRLETK